MIGFLVWVRARIKIRIRVRVGVTFSVDIYHWGNSRRSKCHTFHMACTIAMCIVLVYVHTNKYNLLKVFRGNHSFVFHL